MEANPAGALAVRAAARSWRGAVCAFFLAAGTTGGWAKPLAVYTTTTDLADLARQVGGDRVRVESLAKGYQDPHFVEAKPSLIVKLMKADVFIQNGLELETGWAPLLLRGARNPGIFPGGAGFVEAASFIEPMEVPANPSRAEGDIHPGGNPHFMLDPENARRVARGIAQRLSALAPGDGPVFESNLRAFEKQLDERMERWTKLLASHRNAPFVSYHRNMVYFARRFSLDPAGEIEPKPGIPPTAAHTAGLRETMAARKIGLIVTQPYFESRTPGALARDLGARVVIFELGPSGDDDGETYLSVMERNVKAVAAALGAGR